MSVGGDGDLEAMTTVAVAVKGGSGGFGGRGSRRAVLWAVKNLAPRAERFVLIHAMPAITSIPTPSGDLLPVEDLDTNLVAMYTQDMKAKFEEIFIPFKKLCKRRQVETLVLEGEDPASALLRYISDSVLTNLVLGSSSSNCITRKLKASGVPEAILKHASDTCNIYVVYRDRFITNAANPVSTTESSSKCWPSLKKSDSCGTGNIPLDCKVLNSAGASSVTDVSYSNGSNPNHSTSAQERYPRNLGNNISEVQAIEGCTSLSSTYTELSDVEAEEEQLRQELQTTVSLYNQACEDLVHAQHMVHLLSAECIEDARRMNASLKREETFRNIAAEEKGKRLEVMKEIEGARDVVAKEAYERRIAEVKALKESLEKKKMIDTIFLSDRRYKRYTGGEIELATDFLSDTKVIGEGAYGKVYKCSLDHTPVAIKVLWPDASDKKEEFLREVEILSQLRHPHLVLLLGACPESGCLVYEYMENGSLDNHIFQRGSRPPLPWFVRFRIMFEVASGLAFLHNSKPEPIVHRDLKPGNILLNRYYVTKIGDVGMSKLISEVVPDNVTEYRDSILAGTLYYMDPEYQRTGTLRPKSDLYAFGIVVLQLLSGSQPNGLVFRVENAIANGSFPDILDKSITDWPVSEAEELAHMALKCSKLRCRERPDLETEVLPVLKKLTEFADASSRVERISVNAPKHYYCPILQEIMDDPCIAADGFSYEHKAIKIWLERHNISPVTKLTLLDKILTPNHTLRSAIQEWRSLIAS